MDAWTIAEGIVLAWMLKGAVVFIAAAAIVAAVAIFAGRGGRERDGS